MIVRRPCCTGLARGRVMLLGGRASTANSKPGAAASLGGGDFDSSSVHAPGRAQYGLGVDGHKGRGCELYRGVSVHVHVQLQLHSRVMLTTDAEVAREPVCLFWCPFCLVRVE